MSPPVIIQAGGRGSRLRPYTSVLPKPLMPVGDTPILEIVIRQLARYGFNNLFITTGHLAHLVQAVFGDGSALGAHIAYAREDSPLGTIGPVRMVPRPDEPFIVMNGDLLTDIDYRELYQSHESSDALLTVATYQNRIPVSLGVVEFDEVRRIVAFREKPVLDFWASMGIYVFEPKLWDMIPLSAYGFDNLMADMLRQGQVVQAFPWRGKWLDIGRPEDYERASDEFEEHRDLFLPPRVAGKSDSGS